MSRLERSWPIGWLGPFAVVLLGSIGSATNPATSFAACSIPSNNIFVMNCTGNNSNGIAIRRPTDNARYVHTLNVNNQDDPITPVAGKHGIEFSRNTGDIVINVQSGIGHPITTRAQRPTEVGFTGFTPRSRIWFLGSETVIFRFPLQRLK